MAEPQQCIAHNAFDGDSRLNQLRLEPGVLVELEPEFSSTQGGQWWRGRRLDDGTTGCFPADCVKLVQSTDDGNNMDATRNKDKKDGERGWFRKRHKSKTANKSNQSSAEKDDDDVTEDSSIPMVTATPVPPKPRSRATSKAPPRSATGGRTSFCGAFNGALAGSCVGGVAMGSGSGRLLGAATGAAVNTCGTADQRNILHGAALGAFVGTLAGGRTMGLAGAAVGATAAASQGRQNTPTRQAAQSVTGLVKSASQRIGSTRLLGNNGPTVGESLTETKARVGDVWNQGCQRFSQSANNLSQRIGNNTKHA